MSRGEATLWIDEAVLSGWRASGGKGKRYSDPVLAEPSRGVQDATAPDPGFPRQLQEIARAHDPDPDYSTLARRAAGLVAPQISRGSGIGPLHQAIDSTGLKVFGEGDGR